MQRKPGGRNGGGTWRPGQVRASFLGRSANTLIPDGDIQAYVLARGRGIIGLSEDRWLRPPGRIEFSLLHEVGHCVDYQLGLVAAGARAEDFPGVTTTHCGGGNFMVRRAVEAYSRWICAPARLFNSVPEGRTAGEVNRQLKAVLRRSAAFRTVPDTWEPR